MSYNANAAIAKMEAMQRAGVTYSMYGSRTGADGTADCSGSVYTALRAAGMPNAGYVLSTVTLPHWLLTNGWVCVQQGSGNPGGYKRGDVVIWGRIAASAGGNGHTGIMVNSVKMINCNHSDNGVNLDNHATTSEYGYWVYAGKPYHQVYRYTGAKTTGGAAAPKSSGDLLVDGVWGADTSRKAQAVYKTTIDGIVSSQPKWRFAVGRLRGWQFVDNPKGSLLIAAMQKGLGLKPDGMFGPDTWNAMERRAGYKADSTISSPSNTIKYMQRMLNAGKKPF